MNSNNDKRVQYLSAAELFEINDEVTQGEGIVRDIHLLNSAARRPAIRLFGEEQFPTVIDKAAALLHSLAYHHLFIDGNKRTAMIAVTRFLDRNGYRVVWDAAAQQDFMLEVAQGQHEPPAIAEWLAQRVRDKNQL
jgi:death on curing protein